jgi:hypothetical protein
MNLSRITIFQDNFRLDAENHGLGEIEDISNSIERLVLETANLQLTMLLDQDV